MAIHRNPSTRALATGSGVPSVRTPSRTGPTLPEVRFGCGFRKNHQAQHHAGVRRAGELSERVIPFFLKASSPELEATRLIHFRSGGGDHLEPGGFEVLRSFALTMNRRKYRRVHRKHSESSETICRTPRKSEREEWPDLHGDMQSQAEKMSWPSTFSTKGGNKNVGPYPRCSRRRS